MARKTVRKKAGKVTPPARRRKSLPKDYPPPYEFQFRMGPYKAPAINVGGTLYDERVQGNVMVAGFTDAPIPWPGYTYTAGRHEGLLPILCGDLVRAVCEEEELVVAHYWGVTRHMANEWKKAIAGATNSDQVALNIAMKRHDPEFRKRFGYP